MIPETKSDIGVDEGGIIRPIDTKNETLRFKTLGELNKSIPYIYPVHAKIMGATNIYLMLMEKLIGIQTVRQETFLHKGHLRIINVSLQKYENDEIVEDVEQKKKEQRELEIKFNEYARKWNEETAGLSSPSSIRMNRNYQKIIGLGKMVIPLILRQLATDPDDWFYALEMLVDDNENPTNEEMGFNESVRSWIDWGKDNNLI